MDIYIVTEESRGGSRASNKYSVMAFENYQILIKYHPEVIDLKRLKYGIPARFTRNASGDIVTVVMTTLMGV